MMDPWDKERRPHCWPVGEQCPNPCAATHYERVVYNHIDLGGPWAGWRMAGRYLIGPGNRRTAPRISVDRLAGLLWREAAEARAAAARAENGGHRGSGVRLQEANR